MSVMGIIIANACDGYMGELTNKRTMASLPFGGRYRQIDFMLSNMTTSGIRHIGIISRNNFQSLMAHIGAGEEWDLELGEGGLEYLTPYSQAESVTAFRGKMDSLYSVLEYMKYGVQDDYVVLADAGILCNIDLDAVLDDHIASGKDITVVMKSGVANGKKIIDLGVKLDKNGGIADMVSGAAATEDYLSTLYLYVVSKDLLVRHVRDAIAHNLFYFERDFVLRLYQQGKLSVNVYPFEGVALFTTSVQEYFKSNLAILDEKVRNDLFAGKHPIYTKVRDRVPSYYGEDCRVENCTVADGCFLEGSVKDSVLFRQVSIARGAVVEDSMIMNDTVVGADCYLKCVILDKNVVVRPGTKLIGTPTTPVIIKLGEVV